VRHHGKQWVIVDGRLDAATREQVHMGEPGSGYGHLWWTRDDGTFKAHGRYDQQIHTEPARRFVVAINWAWRVPEFTNGSRPARLALLDAIPAAVDSLRRGNPGR
jgi:CubicO group peptidase (beta-lactamase class C family)